MPRYDALCIDCGRPQEVIALNTKNLGLCKYCDKDALEWVPSSQVAVFKPFMHEHLDHEPVLVKSWKHYKEELQKRNLVNELAS